MTSLNVLLVYKRHPFLSVLSQGSFEYGLLPKVLGIPCQALNSFETFPVHDGPHRGNNLHGSRRGDGSGVTSGLVKKIKQF